MIPSASLDILYRKSPLTMTERIRRVHELGYTAFEFWGWWDKDVEEIARASKEMSMKVGSFLTRQISLVDPAYRSDYVKNLQASIQQAQRLDCPYLITLVGQEDRNVPRQVQLQSLIDGLQSCAPLLEQSGVTLLVEPLNTKYNHPGYFLEKSDVAFHVIEQVGSPAVKIVFDIYHQQISEGNLINNIRDHYDKIGYIHIADHPGRVEPGTGEICYPNVLQAIRDLGYGGFVGLEYTPGEDVELSLARVLKLF
jgi:hydroxypyruvate isomerase